MKKSKMLMAAGTLVLAVTAIFATKANKKFSPISTATDVSTNTYFIKGAAIPMTTTTHGGQLTLQFNGGNSAGSLVTVTNLTEPVFFN